MIKEKMPLLRLKLKKSISPLMNLYTNNAESFYDLFDVILESPFENIWFEIIHILFGYFQLMAYLFVPTVSSIFIITSFSFHQFGIK